MAAPQTPSEPVHLRDVYTVSRLNLEVRAVLDSSFPALWIEGELSNLARPRSGHLYFSLKDENCQVRCAMFRMHNRKLDFTPENGQQVLVRAEVGLYPERGDFQLIVQQMEEAGAGALRRAFDALKARLQKEGLFEQQHKLALPEAPRRIGVITSPTGAALRDILNVLARRYPLAGVLVYPVPVQGQGSAEKIAAAIDRASRRAECDVLILARGGGSLEDLWSFNEEVVARAVHRCGVPLVSGVGHEIDFTIADFVADQRAPTPSAAAELVTPDASEWSAWLETVIERLTRGALRGVQMRSQALRQISKRLVHPRRRLFDAAQKLDSLNNRLGRSVRASHRRERERLAGILIRLEAQAPGRRLAGERERVARLSGRLERAMRRHVDQYRTRVRTLSRTLDATGPQQTLNRGYAIIQRQEDGRVLREISDTAAGETVVARLAKGTITAQVLSAEAPPEDKD